MSADKVELPELPEGCTVYAQPGWLPRRGPADTELVTAGGVLLPRCFYVLVKTPDDVTVVLQFAVEDGEVRLPQVRSKPLDVPHALDDLRKIRPIEFWRRYVITKMVARQLATQLRDEHADDAEAADVESVLLGGDGMPDTRVFLPSLTDIAETSSRVPVSGRRNRITDKHLTEVAEVYKAADVDGRPPTRAVADHFRTSHSTAARWVGLARSRGILPRARGKESS